MKKTEEIGIKLSKEEDWIGDLEDKQMENTQLKQQKGKKRIKK